jgi:hypothetical protein
MDFQNIGILPQHYMASQSRRLQFEGVEGCKGVDCSDLPGSTKTENFLTNRVTVNFFKETPVSW